MNFKLTTEEETGVISFRHERHRHPELSHKEYETTKKIKEYLDAIPGVEILSLPTLKTGVLARIRGMKEGKEVALRSDIDAICQTEENDLPWKSEIPGIMHACGHDFHMASLLGAAHILARNRENIAGTIDLIFQEAEEDTSGMQEMLDDGMLNIIHPEAVFGLHNRPEVMTGQVVCHKGPLMAGKTNARVKIKGKGGHGSMPHLTIDPIVTAAATITALQTIVSRNTDPMDSLVLTVGYVHGGTPEYLVVDEAEIGVTMRALKKETMKTALKHFEMIVQNTAASYGCESEIIYEEKLPCVDNPKELYEMAKKAAENVVGKENIIDTPPALASEDFAVLQNRINGWFYWIGSGTEGKENAAWHKPHFEANDAGIRVAAEVLSEAAMLYLQDRED